MSTRPRALVADDEPMLRTLFALLLDSDYEATAVADGAAAERALLNDPGFAIAVLDCDMPEMSGPEAVTRARAAGCRVPVLFVSGSGNPPLGALADDPPTAFLSKPFSRDELRAAVAALVRTQQT